MLPSKTKEALLTQERLKARFSYDPETGKFTHIQNVQYKGKQAGMCHHSGYRIMTLRIDGKAYQYLEHRLAWLYMTGVWPTRIDHIDGRQDNNSWRNLREVTDAENKWSSHAQYKNNISGVTGVYQHWHGRWGAKYKEKHLGTFKTKEEAIAARTAAEATTVAKAWRS